MNDSGEFEFTLALTHEIVAQRVESLSDEEDRHILEEGFERFRSMRFSNICSISFCRNSDLLSQWRGYSDDGIGYSIGFSTKALSSIGEGDPVRCIYDPADQKRIINELVDDVVRTRDIKNRTDLLIGGFMIAMTQCASFFKDPSFKEENEWRLVVGPKPYTDANFRFRAGKSMLIPYFVLKTANGSWENKIEEVVVGPCPHPEISVMAVEGLLMHNWSGKGTRARVHLSSVPYRSW